MLRRMPLLLLVVFLLGLLGLYAAQTGVGHWQVDEYLYFRDHRILGWRAYFGRFSVSPRPFSELLIYAYGAVVLAWDRALVPAALLIVWGGSLAGTIAAAAVAVRGRWLAAVALGVTPMLFAMQTADVTEMYFWPVATAAYVPMAAAVTAVMFLLGDVPGVRRRRWCGVALLVAATSHEIGAAFAIGFGAVVGGMAVWDRRQRAGFWWWAVPAGAGVAVMLSLVLFRSAHVDLGSDTKPYTGRLLASAGAAAGQMLIDVGGVWPVLHRAVFAAGVAAIWSWWGKVRPNRWQVAVIAGLGVAVYFSLIAAYYHYGDLCCERQSAARQWLIGLGFVVAAAAALGRRPGWRRWGAWAGPVLVLVSLLPIIGQSRAFSDDFKVMEMAPTARAKTWRSGLRAGRQMEFYMPPDSEHMLVRETSLPTGRYDVGGQDAGSDAFMEAVGRFFGKDVVEVCQAWQDERSYLIDGTRFIPACPPHGGPPDVRFDTR